MLNDFVATSQVNELEETSSYRKAYKRAHGAKRVDLIVERFAGAFPLK